MPPFEPGLGRGGSEPETFYYEHNGVSKRISAETAEILAAHDDAVRTRADATGSRVPPRPPRSRRRIMKAPMPKPAIAGFLGVAVVAFLTLQLSHRAATVRYERVRAGWSTGGAAIKFEELSSTCWSWICRVRSPEPGTRYG